MRAISYFPLYIVILLWIQSKRKSPSNRVTESFLAEMHGNLERLRYEITGTDEGFLRTWLVKVVEQYLEDVAALQSVGVVDSGYIPKSK